MLDRKNLPQLENNSVPLAGYLVRLRPLEKKDAQLFVKWINDPEVTQYLARPPFPIGITAEEKWIENLADTTSHLVLGIEVLKTRRLIGSIGFHNIDWISRVATTGTLIGDRRFWGKGYGTDAKMILLNYGFNSLNLVKICSAAIAFNTRSLRYSLRCGYVEDGGPRLGQFFKNGTYYDEVFLAATRETWEPAWQEYRKSAPKTNPRH